MDQSTQAASPYPPEFLELVDKFVNFANTLATERGCGNVSAAILFAAGRYNAFNFLANGGTDQDRPAAIAFYSNEYHKAFKSNLDGVVGPVIRGIAGKN